MSINAYLTNHHKMKFVALFLCALMLFSCMALPDTANAVGAEIGISLIALILSGFGVVASTTGAIQGMKDGLESLMSEFSESRGENSGWFRGLFNTDNISMKGYMRLGIAGVLTAGIKLFVEWLRADKGLSKDTPIVNDEIGGTEIDGVIVPTSEVLNFSTDSYGTVSARLNEPQILQTCYYVFGDYYVHVTLSHGSSVDYYRITGLSSYANVSNQQRLGKPLGVGFITHAGSLYCGWIYQDQQGYYLTSGTNQYGSYSNYGWRYNYSTEETIDGSSWQIDDNNLDTDYLDNDDESTKDVIFSPAFPVGMPFDDLDLGTISGLDEAADRTLEYTQTETGTATGTGEISTETELSPDGGGDLPPISIPTGGFFSTIWHYVVQALQESAAGITFILTVIRTVVPPAILNLAWASCVLLITFGILNKFLK